MNLSAFGNKKTGRARVSLVKTGDRKAGVSQAVRLVEFSPMKGKRVFIKPNFNTADPAPGSTHNDVLAALVKEAKERDALNVTVGDRCGPGDTNKVMESKGIFDLARDIGFDVINFEKMDEKNWVLMNPPGTHWEGGFLFARPLAESEYTVTTGCIKTHAFGGHFTMSMKLSVGAVHRKHMFPQLHNSPDMRKMIAEINLAYRPELVLLDGVEIFTDGGPMEGTRKMANVIIAGTDRVAVDAVGLAILKEQGSNSQIMGRKIFEQDQMRHAVLLGLGVSGPDEIEIVTDDAASKNYAEKIMGILKTA
ncbi:MAG: DUF362 domain-containing protein [Deltaproteobacteria bacterium]|nr:DUF362 domain-containing protein [Deltaproteobacteria bacterium]